MAAGVATDHMTPPIEIAQFIPRHRCALGFGRGPVRPYQMVTRKTDLLRGGRGYKINGDKKPAIESVFIKKRGCNGVVGRKAVIKRNNQSGALLTPSPKAEEVIQVSR
jgi:hypothetical protein